LSVRSAVAVPEAVVRARLACTPDTSTFTVKSRDFDFEDDDDAAAFADAGTKRHATTSDTMNNRE
jgi:hypothetical protein